VRPVRDEEIGTALKCRTCSYNPMKHTADDLRGAMRIAEIIIRRQRRGR
jgi:hypothetical protein